MRNDRRNCPRGFCVLIGVLTVVVSTTIGNDAGRADQGERTVAPEAETQHGRDSQGHRTGLVPLTELGKRQYKGQDGGLYGNGLNEPPKQHLAAAMKQIAEIQPLDVAGEPAEDGKVVFMSVGMSNTGQHFRAFTKLARRDDSLSPHLVLVQGAQGGQSAGRIIRDQSGAYWKRAEEILAESGLTPSQVQAAWLLQAIAGPRDPFPKSAKDLQRYISAMLRIMHQRFPNLKVVYLSSRAYAGYATKALNPEPFAYESAFTVRWMVQAQIAGEAMLNFDPAKGEVKAPLLLWGPYLWADGTTGRACDGLVWEKQDFADDGTHLSPGGTAKSAKVMLEFFKKDLTAKPWFLAPLP